MPALALALTLPSMAAVLGGGSVGYSLDLTNAPRLAALGFARTGLGTLTTSAGLVAYGDHNLLLNSATLSTQNVTTVAQQYTLKFSGAGTVTLSGTGSGVLSAGTNTFTATAGTLTLTVNGSVTAAQLNDGSSATAYVETTSAARYLPRITHDAVTFSALGLLVEPQATQLLAQPDALNVSPWTGNCTATAAADYRGLKTWTLAKTTTSSFEERRSASYTAAATSYCYTLTVWAGTSSILDFVIYNDGAGNHGTGHVITVLSGPGLASVGALFHRVSGLTSTPTVLLVTFTSSAGASRLSLCPGGTGSLVVGDSVRLQLENIEAGSVATSYIPNSTAGTLVRSTDGNWDITGSEFTNLWGAETLGPEKVTNGTFDIDLTGWTYFGTVGGALSVSSSRLRITGNGNYDAGRSTGFAVEAGKRYKVLVSTVDRAPTSNYRLWVSNNPTASSGADIRLIIANGATAATNYSTAFTAVATETLYFWALTNNNVGDWIEIDDISIKEVLTERTIVVEWYDTGTALESGLVMGHVAGSIANEACGLYVNSSNALIYYAKAGGVAQATITAGTIAAGTLGAPVRNKAAFRFGSGAFGVTLNGAAEVTGAGTVPTVTDLRIAGAALVAANPHHDILRALSSRPTAITGAALQALSAL